MNELQRYTHQPLATQLKSFTGLGFIFFYNRGGDQDRGGNPCSVVVGTISLIRYLYFITIHFEHAAAHTGCTVLSKELSERHWVPTTD